MLLNRICRLVLCHDANDSMRYVGFFQVRDFVIRKLQLGGFYGAVYMMQLRCPDNRRGGLGKQPSKRDVFAWTAGDAGAPIIDSAKVSMELKAEDIYEMDVFENFMCSVLNTYAEESVLNEKDTVDYTVFKPVLFEMPGYAYLATDGKIADCLKL